MASAAGRTLGGSVRTVTAIAGAAATAAECRARTPEEAPLGSLILPAEEQDCDAWHVLEPKDISEAATLVASSLDADSAGAAALDLGKRMAQRPSVQAALAEELGLHHRASLCEADLRGVVERLGLENDALRAQNASTQAMLDERERLHRDTNKLVDQLTMQNEALSTSYEYVSPTESISDDISVDQGHEEVEHRFQENENPHQMSDAALAHALQVQEKARCEAIHAQEVADYAFAQHIASHDTQKCAEKPFGIADSPTFTADEKARAQGAKDGDDDDEERSSFLEVAFAVASIIIIVALTRKFSPFLAKKAAKIAVAALAGVVAAFKRGGCV